MKYFSRFQLFFNEGSFQICLSYRKISIQSKLKQEEEEDEEKSFVEEKKIDETHLSRNHRLNCIGFRMISSDMYRNLRSITMIITAKRTKIEAFFLRFFQSMKIDMLTSVKLFSCFK